MSFHKSAQFIAFRVPIVGMNWLLSGPLIDENNNENKKNATLPLMFLFPYAARTFARLPLGVETEKTAMHA